jgi:hypothetical protein
MRRVLPELHPGQRLTRWSVHGSVSAWAGHPLVGSRIRVRIGGWTVGRLADPYPG